MDGADGSPVVAGTPRVTPGIATIPLRVAGVERSIWIRSPHVDAAAAADAAFLLAYGLAMALDVACVATQPVSETLWARAPTFGDIQRSWYPDLGTPAMEGSTRPDATRDGPGRRGVFFSGGLDSFHTAITERAALDALVFVLGADIPVHESALATHVRARLGLAADELGLPLVAVATNLRAVTDDHAPWPFFVGPAMSALALTLGPRFETVLYSASHSGEMAAGRRTDHDAVGNGLVRVLRVEGAAHRTAKARAVGAHPTVRAHLRVCWENRGSAYNCGRCPKCTRTMRELAAAGALAACATLPARMDAPNRHTRTGAGEPDVEGPFLARLPEPPTPEPPTPEARAVAVLRRAAGAARRRVRPPQPRFARSVPPDAVLHDLDPLVVRAVDLASRLAVALRPVLAPHPAVALVGLSPRNAGDALAWVGARELLRRWRIRVAHVSMFPVLDAPALRRRHPSGPILLAGGGNLGSLYPDLQDFRAELLATFRDRPVVQLPQSIEVDAADEVALGEVLAAHPDLTLCVRDEASRRRAEQLGVTPLLCPDAALALAGPERPAPTPGRGRVLWLGRADTERGDVRPPAGTAIDYVDLAGRRDGGWLTDAAAWQVGRRGAATSAAVLRSWASTRLAAWAYRRVADAPVVVTERLHGHILCLLTGTPHVVIPDAFGKIEAFARTWGTLGPGVEVADDPDQALDAAITLAAGRAVQP